MLPKKAHKAAVVTGEYIGNNIANARAKLYDKKIGKAKPVEEIMFPPEKREELLNKLR